ncbi:MAG: TIR domain-containing protein [Acidobacteria bacterium]|nr:TIR domain-containing protein [Acidobacteriota bacterium]
MEYLSRLFRSTGSSGSGGSSKVCIACGARNPVVARFCNRCGLEFKQALTRYDAFVSYRRDGGKDMATIIRLSLEKFSKTVFVDVDELQTGRFDEKLLEAIQRSDSFILVLSPGCLDRCVQKSDWLKREIMHALQLDKCVIPVMLRGFQFPSESFFKQLPDLMRVLPTVNAVSYDHDSREAAIRKILDFMAHPTTPFSGTPGDVRGEGAPNGLQQSGPVVDEKPRRSAEAARRSHHTVGDGIEASQPDPTTESGTIATGSDDGAVAGKTLPSPSPQVRSTSTDQMNSDTHKVIRSLLGSVSIASAGIGYVDNRAGVFNEIMLRCNDDDRLAFEQIESFLQDENQLAADAAAMILIKQQAVPSVQTVERLIRIVRGAGHPLLALDLGNAWQQNLRGWSVELQDLVLRALKYVSRYHGGPQVRHMAIEALCRVGTKEAIEVITEIILQKKPSPGDAACGKDWELAINYLTGSKSSEASLAVADLCRQADDPEILRSVAYWVKCHYNVDTLSDESRRAILTCMQGIICNPEIEELGRRAALTVVINLDPNGALLILEDELPKGRGEFERMMIQAIDEAFRGRERLLCLLSRSPLRLLARERMLCVAGDPETPKLMVSMAEKLAKQLDVPSMT